MMLRGLAGVAGGALLVFVAWGVLYILLIGAISAQAPDPFVANGDPCCGHPDTWGEVAVGVGWTLGCVVIDALLLCLAVALLVWATRGRRPSARRLTIVPAVGLGAATLILAVVLIPQLDEGRTPPDCATFEFSPSGWRSADEDDQRTNAYGVEQCDLLEGRTMREVRALLGQPETTDRVGARTSWSYSLLDVFLEDGRVEETRVSASD